jgi:hypothetical protein
VRGAVMLTSGSRGRFARAEPRARVREYVSGLVTSLERKNGWTLAEGLVTLAPTTPVPGPAMPLPATRLRIQLADQLALR